jgi:hypothetical protein
MDKPKMTVNNTDTLRQKAEIQFKKSPLKTASQLTESQMLGLIHELELQKIELEIQYQDLILATEHAADTASEKYTELYDFAPSAYFTLTQSGVIVELNIYGANMLGKERSQLRNSHFDFFVSENTRPVFDQFVRKIFRSKAQETCEVTLTANGLAPIFVALSGILTASGAHCFITAMDNTMLRQAVGAFRESEEKYRFMFTNNPQPMWIFDLETLAFLEVNHAAVKHYGFSEAEFLRMTLKDIRPPEDIPALLQYVKPDDRTLNDVDEIRHFNKKGELIDVQITWHSVLFNGRKARHVLIHDVTKRKQTEEELRSSEIRYRTLFENSLSGILITHPDGGILAVNPEACRLLGRTEAEICQAGRNGIVNLHDPLLPNSLEVRRKTGHFRGEMSFIHADGTVFPVEMASSVYTDLTGQVRSNIIFQDITKRKQAESIIQLKNTELQKANIEKDKFFSIIAHDLRSPFNGFLGLTQLMEDGLHHLTHEEIKKLAFEMRKSATNLFNLLGNLLEWSSMQRGLTTFVPEPINLLPRLSEYLILVQAAADKKSIAITYDVPDGLVIVADANMFSCIIRNLMNNAVKFTPRGGTITISATSLPEDAAEIAIRDSGIGMKNDLISALFQLDSNTRRLGTDNEPSTGLGLIICKDFIERHGGKLFVESKEGQGSTFRFTLPGKPPQTKAIMAVHNADTATTPKRAGKLLKVLVVEDDKPSEILITCYIKRLSREILFVGAGMEAVEACRNNPDLDLVLMDIKIPEIDGFEATRQIRLFNKQVIIIAITAFDQNENREMAFESGCNGLVTKPLDVALLLELMQEYFG